MLAPSAVVHQTLVSVSPHLRLPGRYRRAPDAPVAIGGRGKTGAGVDQPASGSRAVSLTRPRRMSPQVTLDAQFDRSPRRPYTKVSATPSSDRSQAVCLVSSAGGEQHEPAAGARPSGSRRNTRPLRWGRPAAAYPLLRARHAARRRTYRWTSRHLAARADAGAA